jgi:hypothetical protein
MIFPNQGDFQNMIFDFVTCITELWPFAGNEVEYHVLEVALVGKNHRAKEMSMLWGRNILAEQQTMVLRHLQVEISS